MNSHNCESVLCDPVKKLEDLLIIFSWDVSLRAEAKALWIYTKRMLGAAEVVCILVQSLLMLHWNINSVFRCSFACKATIASTEGQAVTFILQSVLKEAWNVSGRRLAAARFVIFLPVVHRWLKTDACCALLQATRILEVWKLLVPERHHSDLFLFFLCSPFF